jgi:homopolymeric O-antigen transport system ATP-binding protein
MSAVAIQTKGLSKLYRIGEVEKYPTIREALVRAVSAPLCAIRSWGSARNNGHDPDWIWALRDVDFEVKHGEVLGIIGRNGAGKSTLLKILSGITEPTAGYADIYGRVGSLLEVGTGFHMELTGRENIFMNGALLGMSRNEIKRKFDEIVAFAEIEKFLDTPVKRYSSGMYMRLAFAVAAHLDPEILLIDEVLAVGDAAFQKKCLGKMGAVAKEGRTVIFVSHNLLAIETLCKRVIWLEEGNIVQEGDAGQITADYAKRSLASSSERVWTESTKVPESEQLVLQRVSVNPSGGTLSDPVRVNTPFLLNFEYWNFDSSAQISVGFCLYNEQDVLLFDICSPFDHKARHRSPPTGLLRSVCHLPGNLLNAGLYRVALNITRNNKVVVEQPEALVFAVLDSEEERSGWYGKWPGVLRPVLNWETNVLAGIHRMICIAEDSGS